MRSIATVLTAMLVSFAPAILADGNHAHPAPAAATPAASRAPAPIAQPVKEFSELADHLVFDKEGVHVHAYWKNSPEIDVEEFLRLEFRDAATHKVTKAPASISVSVWNETHGYGLFEPSVEPTRNEQGEEVFGLYDVSGIYFLASGQWQVRIFLNHDDGTSSFQEFNVDLGEEAPNPMNDPNSPIHNMMDGMHHHKPAQTPNAKPTAPAQTPAASHEHNHGRNPSGSGKSTHH